MFNPGLRIHVIYNSCEPLFFFLRAMFTVFTRRAEIPGSEARVSLHDYRASVLISEKHSVELDEVEKKKDKIQ